jgi:UPF0271 protein
MVRSGAVTAVNGGVIKIVADTLCIHGDGSRAVDFATAIRKSLAENGVRVLSPGFSRRAA